MFCPNCGTLVADRNSCPKCFKTNAEVDSRLKPDVSADMPQPVLGAAKDKTTFLDRLTRPKISGAVTFAQFRKNYNIIWLANVAAIPIFYFCTVLMRVDGKKINEPPVEMLYALAAVGVFFFFLGLYVIYAQLKPEKLTRHKSDRYFAAAYIQTVCIIGIAQVQAVAIFGVVDSILFADDHYKFYFFAAGLTGLVFIRMIVAPKWRFIEGFSQDK